MQCITVTDIIAGMDVYAVAGDPLRLTCQLSSDSSVDCSTPLLARSRQRPLGRRVQQRQVSESAVELVIEHVSAVDRGRYFCYTGPDDDPTPTSGVTVYVTSQFSCIIIIVVVVFCFVSELLKKQQLYCNSYCFLRYWSSNYNSSAEDFLFSGHFSIWV